MQIQRQLNTQGTFSGHTSSDIHQKLVLTTQGFKIQFTTPNRSSPVVISLIVSPHNLGRESSWDYRLKIQIQRLTPEPMKMQMQCKCQSKYNRANERHFKCTTNANSFLHIFHDTSRGIATTLPGIEPGPPSFELRPDFSFFFFLYFRGDRTRCPLINLMFYQLAHRNFADENTSLRIQPKLNTLIVFARPLLHQFHANAANANANANAKAIANAANANSANATANAANANAANANAANPCANAANAANAYAANANTANASANANANATNAMQQLQILQAQMQMQMQ
jgi:hypothetical protein